MSADRLPALILMAATIVAGALTYRAFAGEGDVGRKFTAANYRSMPVSFDSIEEARQWARGNMTGGRVDHLSVPGPDVMVVFQHGSGVPVIGIGVYRRHFFSWKLIARPHAPDGDFFRVSVSDRMLILRGERRGGTFPLFELK